MVYLVVTVYSEEDYDSVVEVFRGGSAKEEATAYYQSLLEDQLTQDDPVLQVESIFLCQSEDWVENLLGGSDGNSDD